MEREDGYKDDSRQSKGGIVKEEESTHNTYQALSVLETVKDEKAKEESIYVFDKSDNGKWVRKEAVVDSGAVECVTSRQRMPHLRKEKTSESTRRETWTCAARSRWKAR